MEHAAVPAILDAAAELFGEHGPRKTSLRQVAARAGVTYGLVFRHFGTKVQLVGAVLDHLGRRVGELFPENEATSVFEAAVDLHTRVMVRATLDGYDADKLQTAFPGVSRMFEEIRQSHETEAAARLAVANSIALQLSWRLFEPYLRSATGLGELPSEQLQIAIADATRAVMSGKPARPRNP